MPSIQRMAKRAIGRVLPVKLLENKSLPELVKMQRALMGAAAGVPKSSHEKAMRFVRSQLLDDTGIPADIQDMLKKGRTPEEIKAYYWGCEEFREFWHDIECTEGMIDFMIQDADRQVHKK